MFEPHQCHCLVSLSKNINPSLVLVQPRKTCPFITERLLMECKESNQTNKHSNDPNFHTYALQPEALVITSKRVYLLSPDVNESSRYLSLYFRSFTKISEIALFCINVACSPLQLAGGKTIVLAFHR